MWHRIREELKKETVKNIILMILLLFSLWIVLAVQLHCLPLVNICFSEIQEHDINTVLLTLSYSYIVALIFYIVTCVLPSKRRKDILAPIINRKIQRIGRCIHDILLEFSRKTDYGHDVHNTTNTDALLRSKDWFAIVPMINEVQKVPVTYLRLSDEQVWQHIIKIAGVYNSSSFQELDKEKQRETLRALLDMGSSVRQLQRLTGLGRGIIQRV